MVESLIVAFLESVKSDECRIPCHPEHFKILHTYKNKIFFQVGYAEKFGVTDSSLQQLGFEVAPRDRLLQESDIIFLLKPVLTDLRKMKKGSTLVGWCHAVQCIEVVAIAQERGLTLIAMEAMFKNNKKYQNIFYENNFSAGFLGIDHSLNAVPYKYKKDANISVISYGAVGQGVVTKLVEKGFSRITVFSRRFPHRIENKFFSVYYKKVTIKQDRLVLISGEDLSTKLLNSDIIVNSIMQNVLSPCYFLSLNDLFNSQNKLIVDLSCDDNMGFDFTEATAISNPIKMIGANYYYAVSNVPSLDWEKNSFFISEKLLPFFNGFLSNSWSSDLLDILEQATEIRNGLILNSVITKYRKKLKL